MAVMQAKQQWRDAVDSVSEQTNAIEELELEIKQQQDLHDRDLKAKHELEDSIAIRATQLDFAAAKLNRLKQSLAKTVNDDRDAFKLYQGGYCHFEYEGDSR
jgi:hypothetical protein